MNLNQITVPSIDVEKSIDFYEKLGLRLIVKDPRTKLGFGERRGSKTMIITNLFFTLQEKIG